MNRKSVRSILSILTVFAIGVACQASAQSPAYPTQPISMTVSFPPGGVTDAVARALAEEMSKNLKQRVLVVNKAGASGTIGTAAIATSPANGYNIGFIAVASLTILPQMQQVPYDLASFDYLCRAFDVPVFVLVTPDSRFKTMRELVDYARANPDKLNYATVGAGSLPHMAALDLSKAAGIELHHIPYKGEGPAVADLLGKHIDLYFGTNAVATAHKLRRLATASESRNEEAPDTPTLTELGYKVVWSIMGGMIAPKGMDAGIRNTLQKSCAEASAAPAFKSALENLKVRPLYGDSATFRSTLVAEVAKNRVLLKDAGLLSTSPAPAAGSR